mmetsp:Transcript_29008/g.92764  ORF Transcript_29008/g.92764 Transcript_29008/m.92764 type:complete len:407 (+) Transcript_29008:655-1875(+)
MEWVQAVVAGLGVCPFATSAQRAGLPLGDVYYPIDRCTDAEKMYKSFWNEVVRVQQSDERSLSTTMLVAPKFTLTNADAFDEYASTLTKALEPLGLDEGSLGIQLVFFHPFYEFRDGADRMDAGVADSQSSRDAAAGNYARRSPHPMINILRTPQVRAAQRVIPTGAVYVQNQRTLGQVGTEKLQDMLEGADWEGLEGNKVDRRQGLWKRAATVTQAVEDAQGSREGITELDFDDVEGDLEQSLREPIPSSSLEEGEEPLDLGVLQNLVGTPGTAAAPKAPAEPETPEAATPPTPPKAAAPAAAPQRVMDGYENDDEDIEDIARMQRAAANAEASGLSAEQREDIAWMIELLQRRVSVSQGEDETLRLQGVPKVNTEGVAKFMELARACIADAREYDATQPDPRAK